MDPDSTGRPPTHRRALAEVPHRANRTVHSRSHADKLTPDVVLTSSPQPLPHNESLMPNGTLAVRHAHPPSPSPQHKRVSAVIEGSRPRNTKRDSEVSTVSTIGGGRRKTHIGPWQLGKTIGKGGCSRVRIVRHSGTGQYGAAKIISKATADRVRALSLANLANAAEHDPALVPHNKVIPFGLEREICIMKLLDHPNIVHLYDIWENRNELYLIMEYIEGGELFGYMSERGALPEIEVVHIFRQIIAALYYCHRINIHHRDLKPENILLDRQTMQIKLVDFGMAALQPRGKKLTTPCGSPHYAAPEVIAMRPYDGGMADIWSCGVILYVLLTSQPPFNYSGDDDHIKHLFRAISEADYVIPDWLSPEARDLVRRILTVNPKHRIPIDEIWDHPFLHKYDAQLNNVGENATIGSWVGPELQLRDWQKLTPKTIDREILRYMRTLWHSESESKLIQRLVSKEPNFEKYFYSALQKYQHDQLENYIPSPYTVAYSRSDYHHNGRHSLAKVNSPGVSSQNQIHSRSQSGYSILNNEHLYSKHSFCAPSSEASYDPYKSSKVPIIPNQNNHRHVTVHRGSSNSSGYQKHRPATAMGHRNSSLRIHVMKKNSMRSSTVSHKSSVRSNASRPSTSPRHGSASRSSLSNSPIPSSPPAYHARRASKRGVSFSHSYPYIHGSSQATVGTAAIASAHNTSQIVRGASAASSSQSPRPNSTDFPSTRPLPRTAMKPDPRLRVQDPESPTKYISTEVKKVSTELCKVMDEAFNRASTESSVRISSTVEARQDGLPFETPPTSISNRGSGGTTLLTTPANVSAYQNRPLPPTPTDTPKSYVHRNIESLRTDLAQKFARSGEHTENMSLILQKLGEFEQMLLAPPKANGGMRVCSAPARSGEQPGGLQVIPEEMKDSEERLEPYSPNYRAFTDPVRPVLQGRRAATELNTTIRVVDPSPTRIEPLNIRKKSGATISRGSGRDNFAVPWPGPTTAPTAMSHEMQNRYYVPQGPVLELIEPVVKKKKSSWFRRNVEEKERPQEQAKSAPAKAFVSEKFLSLDDRLKDEGPTFVDATKLSNATDSTEFPMRSGGRTLGKSEGGGAFKGFFGLFGKKSKEAKSRRALELADNFSTSSIFPSQEADSEEEPYAQPIARDFQTNWLSRFLHIKPASKILCIQGRRPVVRKQLMQQLRAWERNGLKDLSCKDHVITARVDKINDLNVKAVSFVIELFVVLQYGADTQVCLARFTQTAGSATGFRKAADCIEQLYRDRGLLVEDEEKKAAMCEVLNS